MRHSCTDQRLIPSRHTAQPASGKLPDCSPQPSPRATWASGYHAMVEQGRGMERPAPSSPNREESRHG